MELKNNFKDLNPNPSVIPGFISFLIEENEISKEKIEELQAKLEERKKNM